MTARAKSRLDWLLVAGVAAAILARLAHWLIADRVWEDALITLAHVRNAVEGHGLTHHPGEGPTHGFTSALSVVVPLAGELVVAGSGLAVLRIVSLAAAVASVVIGYHLALQLGAGRWGRAFVMAYLALDYLQIFFGMAGMETQIATAVLLAGALAVLRGHVVAAGLLAAIGILARPDFIIWAVLVLAWAAMRGAGPLLRASGALVAVVAPWVAFTLAYYGSPIPQTIVAKGLAWASLPEFASAPTEWLAWAADRGGFGLLAVLAAFIPFYQDGVAVAAPIPAGFLSVVGISLIGLGLYGAWLTGHVPNWWPALAYLAAFTGYWVALLPLGYFMWYQPPFLALFSILVGAAIGRFELRSTPVAAGVAIILSVAVAVHLPWSIPLDRKIQLDIEDGVRRPVGGYLSQVVSPGQAFTTESAGYFGYHAGVQMWDYPGLTSPTALAAVRELPRADRNLTAMIDILRPAWLVLRPGEWEQLRQFHPDAAACYTEDRWFGTPQPQVIELNGLARWNQDHAFVVLRRADACTG